MAASNKPPDPDLAVLTSADFEKVYEPAEDSYLLLDALALDLPAVLVKIQSSRPQTMPVAMEIGCGSGIVSTFLSRIAQGNVLLFASDINPDAARCASALFRHNKVPLLV